MTDDERFAKALKSRKKESKEDSKKKAVKSSIRSNPKNPSIAEKINFGGKYR